MRILFITDLFPSADSPYGGNFVYNSMERMAGKHEVRAIIPTSPGVRLAGSDGSREIMGIAARRFERHGRLVAHRVSYRSSFLIRREFLKAYMLVNPVAREIRELREGFTFDIIVGVYMVPGGYLAAKFAAKYKVPCITIGVGSDVNLYRTHFMLKGMVKYALRRSTLVLLNTKGLVENCVKSGADEEKIRILYFGVDDSVFNIVGRRRSAGAPPVIAMAANMVEVKRPLVCAKALEDLHKKGIDFKAEIAGEGHLRQEFARYAENAGYGRKIVFHGAITDRKGMADFFRRADVTILTSYSEGLPFVLLESLACGTPVVASDLPGIREIVTSGCNGVLVPREDLDGYAAAIEKVLSMEVDPASMADSVRTFSWERHIAAFDGCLNEAVRRHASISVTGAKGS